MLSPGAVAPGGRACSPRLKADLVDALKAQLAEKDARIELLERLLAEKEARLGERDEQIGALRRRVRALADVE